MAGRLTMYEAATEDADAHDPGETRSGGGTRAETAWAGDGPAYVERTELLTTGPADGLAALLEVASHDADGGSPLPLLWHWLYLMDRPAIGDIGPDGHAVRRALPAPPGSGWRRMRAGGVVRTLGPLRTGQPATRRSRVVAVVDKVSRAGPMTCVTVRHEISQDGTVRVEDDQNIVYRSAGTLPASADHRSDHVATGHNDPGLDAWRVDTPITLLFHFAALTYNGHRIHYDRAFARDVEGHPGLVVPGPLQTMLMAEHLRRNTGPPAPGSRFRYRLLAPAFEGDGLVVSRAPGNPRTVNVHTRSGRHTATAVLAF